MASQEIRIGKGTNNLKLVADSEHNRVTEDDMRKRIDELESALMPFAALGKSAVTDLSPPRNLSISSSFCIGAYRTLFKQ